jgi:hypothetical protein
VAKSHGWHDDPAGPMDRRWHSWPGTELPVLAFDLGYRQVVTLDSKIVRSDPAAAGSGVTERESVPITITRGPRAATPRELPRFH